jgi:hypothetical protein
MFATSRTPQPLYDVLERRIPAGDRRKGSRVSISHVATLTFECEHVLAKIVGQLDDRQWRARWHHRLYIHTAMR